MTEASEEKTPFTMPQLKETMKSGTLTENPICFQTLGICSALAVTGKVSNTIVMCIALTFVLVCSNVFVSLLRKQTPRKVRIIAEMAIISSFVIIFDQLLKAYWYDMSKNLGPYVGLIITNCIVMGRAEACAMSSRPVKAFWDGLANGIGYSIVLLAVSVVRELLGNGTLLGFKIMGENFDACLLMVLPAGAFFVLGVVLWIMTAMIPRKN
jgi:Na+-transporting NADH:ubiquinone oxidoreductase subunit D